MGLDYTESDFTAAKNTMFSSSVNIFLEEPKRVMAAGATTSSSVPNSQRPALNAFLAEKQKAPLASQDIRVSTGHVRPGIASDGVPGVQRKPRAPKRTGIEELVGARSIRAVPDVVRRSILDCSSITAYHFTNTFAR